MLVESEEFKCFSFNCSYHLYKYNSVHERLQGSSGEQRIINCERCGAKYVVNGDEIVLRLAGRDLKQPKNQGSRTSYLHYIIYGFAVIGGLIVAGSWIMDQPSFSSNTSKSTDSVQQSVNLPVVKSSATSKNTATPSVILNKCHFDQAKTKAIAKLEKADYYYLSDRFEPNTDDDQCTIQYYFYVKKKRFDNGVESLEDQVLEVNMSFKRISNEFHYLEGKIFDVKSNTYQIID